MSFSRRHCQKFARFITSRSNVRSTRRMSTRALGEPDSCGIPRNPTWSVYELLSSYPSPVISSVTLKQIHDLSALIPPEEGTPEHESLQRELGVLIKLVEAVRLVDTKVVQFAGRHYEEDWDRRSVNNEQNGESLLRHASRTEGGFYVVDADRRR